MDNLKISIRELAQHALGIPNIQIGREKMKTQELIEKHPDEMTLESFDIIAESEEKGTTFAYTVKEEPKKFMFAGVQLVQIFKSLLDATEGDIGEANEMLKKEPLKIKMEPRVTRNGNSFNRVSIL